MLSETPSCSILHKPYLNYSSFDQSKLSNKKSIIPIHAVIMVKIMKQRILLMAATALLTQAALAVNTNTSPSAYLHAYASGDNNQQVVVRLPLQLNDKQQLVGMKGASKITDNGYAWELAGQYNEECDYRDTKIHGGFLDKLIETGEMPRQQSLVVLSDSSYLFSCERSNIVLKHPNRNSSFQPTASSYTELNLDISEFLNSSFDGRLLNNKGFNKDYGISLAYNKADEVVYVGIEDRVYVLDLIKWRETSKAGGKDIEPHFLYKATKNSTFFYPLKSDDGNPFVHKGFSIINLALVYQPDGRHYLFASSATDDHKWGETPIKMALLNKYDDKEALKDGRSTSGWQQAPFNTAMQYASLGSHVDAKGNHIPEGKGLKADVTEIASDVDYTPGQPLPLAVLTAHIHHNEVAAIFEPQYNSEAVKIKINNLQKENNLNQQTIHPDIYSEIMREELFKKQTNKNAAMIRLANFRIENFTDIKPNYHSGNERILDRIKKGKSPKLWLNNDVLAVYKQTLFSMPWKDDISLKVMAYPLENKGGWLEKPPARWYEAAELPDMAKQRTAIYDEKTNKPLMETFLKPEAPQWWPDGVYWSDIYVDHDTPEKASHDEL